MKRVFLFCFLFASIAAAQVPMQKCSAQLASMLQEQSGETVLKCWVFFTDKGPDAAAQLLSPESVLSEKSIERRKLRSSLPNIWNEADLPVYGAYMQSVVEAGVRIHQQTRWFNGISGYVALKNIPALTALPFVKSIDIVRSFAPSTIIESDEKALQPENFSVQPDGVHSLNYGLSYDQLQIINVPAIHDLGYFGQGVTIALMDAEFTRLTHDAFNQMSILSQYDFVNNDNNVTEGTSDHGTLTLSTIGGYTDWELVGPAFQANFILCQTEDVTSETPAEEDNWIAAMEWADLQGVDVTSTSLSYLENTPPFAGYTWEDMDGNTAIITRGADLAVQRGILVFNSAGNDGYNPDHNTLCAPADGDSVIAVGSVESNSVRSGFSSVGNTVDGRTKPDLMARGGSVRCASTYGDDFYTVASGTSLSCPLAAGAGALLLCAYPELTPMQVRELLRSTALNAANPNREYGWGIIDLLAAFQQASGIDDDRTVPSGFRLEQNYPNPFNPVTTLRYSLSETADVTLTVYNTLGEIVSVPVQATQNAGSYEAAFSADQLPSGVYIARLTAGAFNATVKMTLLK